MNSLDYITPDVKNAAALAAKVRLVSISTVSLTAKLISAEEPKLLSYDLAKVVIAWRIDGKDLRVVMPFGLSVMTNDDDDGAGIKIADLGVGMQLVYAFKDSPTEQDFECVPHFVGVTGYMHAWPYFRADIQYLTTKIGFPALVLPIVISGEVPSRVSVMARTINAIAEHQDAKKLPPAGDGTKRKKRKIPKIKE